MRPLAVGNGQMLALELRMPSFWRSNLALLRLATFIQPDYHPESRLWSIGREGASAFAMSHFDLRCPHRTAGEGPLCAAYDGIRTGIYSLDPAARSLTPLASMTGPFFPRSAGAGWMAGWWEHAPVLVHPATRTVLRVDADDQERPDLLALATPIVGAVWTNANQSTVRLYSIN